MVFSSLYAGITTLIVGKYLGFLLRARCFLREYISDPIRKIAMRIRFTIPKKIIRNEMPDSKYVIDLAKKQFKNSGDDKTYENNYS